jgi:hypothetical protein
MSSNGDRAQMLDVLKSRPNITDAMYNYLKESAAKLIKDNLLDSFVNAMTTSWTQEKHLTMASE